MKWYVYCRWYLKTLACTKWPIDKIPKMLTYTYCINIIFFVTPTIIIVCHYKYLLSIILYNNNLLTFRLIFQNCWVLLHLYQFVHLDLSGYRQKVSIWRTAPDGSVRIYILWCTLYPTKTIWTKFDYVLLYIFIYGLILYLIPFFR